MGDNDIGDAGAKAINDALDRNFTLIELNITGCTDELQKSIQQKIERNKKSAPIIARINTLLDSIYAEDTNDNPSWQTDPVKKQKDIVALIKELTILHGFPKDQVFIKKLQSYHLLCEARICLERFDTKSGTKALYEVERLGFDTDIAHQMATTYILMARELPLTIQEMLELDSLMPGFEQTERMVWRSFVAKDLENPKPSNLNKNDDLEAQVELEPDSLMPGFEQNEDLVWRSFVPKDFENPKPPNLNENYDWAAVIDKLKTYIADRDPVMMAEKKDHKKSENKTTTYTSTTKSYCYSWTPLAERRNGNRVKNYEIAKLLKDAADKSKATPQSILTAANIQIGARSGRGFVGKYKGKPHAINGDLNDIIREIANEMTKEEKKGSDGNRVTRLLCSQ